ncbi:winged helix-turn-helix domain-containing protein [Halobaculum magnesiiphilum]|uniref:Winged helix-turn-helix domain-containing protein n=1 Tax=Halobaculum magnesiiphilum TaxID=1017351 RepID=A0A8T8WDQ7_9EURY|nr:winged helix-turn-helix domain-containing protein [Halobaculum magnesiiphilum]QZP38007.1 winged helix-turn-helix domain-containing protein [Halobaculum magnesiiphilum]
MSDDAPLGESPEPVAEEEPSSDPQADRQSPEDSFAVVANDTRLSILRELHDRVAVADRTEYTVPFTELREAVGEPDSGKFSYHLNQLLGEFVEKRPEGYAILYPGTELVRTVKSGAVGPTEHAVSEPTSASCYLCGAPVCVAYTYGYVSGQCTDCRGALGFDYMPEGTLSSIPVPGAAVGDEIEAAPEALLDRVHGRFCHRARTFGDGSCPRCGGRTESRIRVCTEHDASDGPCVECGTTMSATVQVTCEVCSEGGISPAACMVSHRAPFREALAAAGVDSLGYDAFAVTAGWTVHVVDGDEPAVEYDLAAGRVRVVVDGDIRILR